ncbi:MFS domain-containing protein [Trichostrongylus colubriformis]|uniref:MFS domain-containing protein n=1 Tax=Trichostrongylus colubriformis TaxID=6319 RepID=A0AAN8F0Q5_TRICO
MACIFMIEFTADPYIPILSWVMTACTCVLSFLLVTAEVYPTAIRNLANSHINVFGRLGNVFGPLAFSLPTGIAGFPYLVMATIGFLDIVFFQFTLPETKGHPLPSEMPAKKNKKEVVKLIDRA